MSVDRAALLARIRAALRSQSGSGGDDSDISDLPDTAFSEIPESAFQALGARWDALAGDGQPIDDLFSGIPTDAANQAALTLLNGLTQGPIAIAQNLAQVLSMSESRAETIARNELIGSYRDAQMANYRANSDVVGQWMWSAAIASACIMCVEMDGTVHSMDEDLLDHVCGRCEPLPITKSWDDIMAPYGLSADGIPETRITESYGNGHDWFMSQDAATQRDILGPAKFEAWSRGDISLNDLVGIRDDGAWGNALYERSLKDLGLDARDYLPAARASGLGPQGIQAIKGAERTATEMDMVRIELPGGGYTYVLRDDASQFDVNANLATAQRDAGWQNINDVMAKLRGQQPGTGELELREPKTPTAAVAATKTAYTQADLTGKTMAELRQIAKDAGVTPARTKAETIDRILAKSGAPEGKEALAERVATLRRQVDEQLVERDALYKQQSDLIKEQDKLLNQQNPQQAQALLNRAENLAKQDLYRSTLDQSDPEVKRYLKDRAAYEKAGRDLETTKAEQDRLQHEMDMLALQGKKGSADYAQAKADYDAAVAANLKAQKASERAWDNLWTKSPSVYKPELDSIVGFERKMQEMGVTFTGKPVDITKYHGFDVRQENKIIFTPKDVANHPIVLEAKAQIASLDKRIAEVKTQVQALEKPIKDINKQIDKGLAQLRSMREGLAEGIPALDTMRPFSDVVDLPRDIKHEPPNAIMQKLDYKNQEPRKVTKSRIIDDINKRLKNNPEWQAYVARAPKPELGRTYHSYIGEYATAKDTKSAQLVADWIKKWGVGYRPGSPEWVAMQRAVNDEFGLNAVIHGHDAAKLAAGEAYYAENGAAIRALLRAMYDNTQQWFAEHGITEIELYRGFGWQAKAGTKLGQHAQWELARNPDVPEHIIWGEADHPNYGVGDIELNPFQSFSADINISQGTGAGNGFAGGGFGGGADYSLLIGVKVPVDRILSTAQSGFGAKLESEVVVMGRATDTVAYRAGTKVEAELVKAADEQALSEREMLYSLADGTKVSVAANADGTFTMTYQDGPQKTLGSFKAGQAKVYKTEKGVNKALSDMRFSNTYTAPAAPLEIREGEQAAAQVAQDVTDGLAARVDNIPADVATVPDIQDWMQQQLPNVAQVDLMSLDAQTARLVANASVNLIGALPDVAANIGRIAATNTYSDAVAMVPRDGLSLIFNTDKWTDLAGLAERSAKYAQDGWWIGETPEEIIGHEIGHALQINYAISNDTWLAAMERVAAAGGNPLVSTYAGDKIEESFAETFALLVYGTPTDAQLPIAREMAETLSQEGIDYNALRAAVGVSPLDLSE